MRMVRGTINAVLLVTLIRPAARLLVGRWRRRAQESRAAAIGVPMQELFEAALAEELAETAAAVETVELELPEQVAGRSVIRLVVLAGVVITVTTALAYGIVGLVQRRRQARREERDLVAVPIEVDEDVAAEAVGATTEEELVP